MVHGPSSLPQYASDGIPPQASHPAVRRNGSGRVRRGEQGDHSRLKYQVVDAYAVVDAWRSYREDTITLSRERKDRSHNAPVSKPLPADALNNHLKLQSNSYFKPYQPLRSVYNSTRYPKSRVIKAPTRSSNRTSEVRLVQT